MIPFCFLLPLARLLDGSGINGVNQLRQSAAKILCTDPEWHNITVGAIAQPPALFDGLHRIGHGLGCNKQGGNIIGRTAPGHKPGQLEGGHANPVPNQEVGVSGHLLV